MLKSSRPGTLPKIIYFNDKTPEFVLKGLKKHRERCVKCDEILNESVEYWPDSELFSSPCILYFFLIFFLSNRQLFFLIQLIFLSPSFTPILLLLVFSFLLGCLRILSLARSLLLEKMHIYSLCLQSRSNFG